MGFRTVVDMRFLRFTFPYVPYIEDFLSRQSTSSDRSFEDLDAALKGDLFSGASDSLSVALRDLGYEVRDYAFNVEVLQKAWASERGLPPVKGRWDLEIARAQVLEFRPEILMVNPFSVPEAWLTSLRADAPYIRLVIARHSSPRSDLSPFRVCDVVLSGDASQVDELKRAGFNGVLLHHGFDTRVLESLPARKPRPTILFTGQLRGGRGFHNYRTDVVRALIDADLPVDLRLLTDRGIKAGLKRKVSRLGGGAVPLDPSVRKLARPPVFGLEMFRAMRLSAVVLNVHGDVSMTDANNLRLWEATGVGTCLLTDSKRNLGSLFEVGREVVAFDSPEDAVDKARELLADATGTEAVAAAGQQRTLRDHTYGRRAAELDEIVRRALHDTSPRVR